MVRISATEDPGSSDRLSTLLHRCFKMYIRACHLLAFFWSLLLSRPPEACENLTLLGSHCFPSCFPDICTQSYGRAVYCPLTCDALFGFYDLSRMFLPSPLGSQAVSYPIFQSQCIQQFFRGASSPLLMRAQPLVIPPSSLLPHCVVMAVTVSQRGSELCGDHLLCLFCLSINILWHRTINWGCINYGFVKVKSILNRVEVTHILYNILPPAIPLFNSPLSVPNLTQNSIFGLVGFCLFLWKHLGEIYSYFYRSQTNNQLLFRWLCACLRIQQVALSSVAEPVWSVHCGVTFD